MYRSPPSAPLDMGVDVEVLLVFFFAFARQSNATVVQRTISSAVLLSSARHRAAVATSADRDDAVDEFIWRFARRAATTARYVGTATDRQTD